MTHTIIRRSLILLLLASCATAFAQQSESGILADQGLKEARELLQSGRKEFVAEELHLNEAEARAFWPVYDEYHAAVMVVRDRHAETLGDYLKTYQAGAVTDQYAEELIDKELEFRSDLLDVQEKYLKKFKKALPIRKVARFYQLESKMDAEIDAQLALFVPLMDAV